jgi:hypothetical protein
MSKTMSLLAAAVVAAAVWFGTPYISDDFTRAWFTGTGDWRTIAIMGRDIAAGVAGLVVWVLGLHSSGPL